jgi:transposase
MADGKRKTECPRCAELEAQLAALQARVAALEAALAKAQKNSSNSSKPPSSDIVNPRKKQNTPGRRKKRKIGGQPGHERHLRTPFTEEELDEHWLWHYRECPCCGGKLVDADGPPRVLQQVELPLMPVCIEQHDSQPQWCAQCAKTFHPRFPDELRKAGLVGPRLTALVGFLKGACHLSFGAIRKYFRDVISVRISRGMLRKLVGKVSASLLEPYEALLAMLPREDRLNVDETGHKENGKRLWTWCFRAYLYTVYKISPSRGSDVLLEVLGKEFNGVLGCDYFSAYRKYMRLNENVLVQFCLSHLIRDVKFLVSHPDKRNQKHGKRLVEDLRKLFGVIDRRDEYASEATFRRALESAEGDLVWDATVESPHTREALALEERFYLHTESYFRFITEPNVEPTNNLAEQAIRFVAIHRRLTQGTRSEDGRRWCERIFTVVQTCGQQGRSVFEFSCAAVTAYIRCESAPSLLPDSVPAPNTS